MTGHRNSTRAGLVDATVIVAVVVLTLSILDDSYSDRSYLVAGLGPGLLLLVLAFLTRWMNEGGWWYALGATVLFAPLGALFALRSPGPYALPTLETMNRVMGETIGAPGVLVSTVPPADAEGQVMLVPFVIGYFAVGFAAWLALGTRSAVAPAVPLVLAIAGAIPVGVLVPSLLVPRGIVLAVVLVVWVSVRARRNEALVGDPRGSWATTVTALAVVVTVSLLSSVIVPDRNEDDRVLLRGDGNSDLVSGAASSALPPQVGRHRQLFRATGVPDGRRLRFAVLDHYDGYLWAPADVSPGSDGFGTFKRIGRDLSAVRDGESIEVGIEMRAGYSGDWLPLLGDLTRLDLEEFDGRSQLEDVRYNTATASAFVVGGVDPRDSYTFSSVLGDDSLTLDDRAHQATADQRQPAGEYLDRHLEPFVRPDLSRLERVLLLARYLRANGATRFTGPSLQGPDDLGRGMLGSRDMTGTPFQYAALMALGASRLGVPGRVVTGAVPGNRGIVEHQDVGVWVELQLADGTWHTLEPRRYVGADILSNDDADAAGDDPEGFVADLLDGAGARDGGENDTPDESMPAAVEDGEDAEDGAPPPRLQVALLLAGVVVALLLTLLLVPLAKWVRRSRRRRTSSWSGVYVHGWQEVLDAAQDRGTPVPEAWSRVAQARGLGAGLDLARRADAAVFAPEPPSLAEGSVFWDECQELRRTLVAGTRPRRRLWTYVTPASLLAGWARGRGHRSGGQPRHEDRRPRRQHAAGA
ncbi:transglutaminase-like domain-containing protein [Nocardioides lacusdianchii]|uniref:transglutaminase-like domain-containing protein n=1 Tax=Nocardioides lacusdianchii TaxID=2783664 RepID=UPI001CC9A44E|nr:transglutaminase-like domain-containing protein [Nocardioides lacusdianchii]